MSMINVNITSAAKGVTRVVTVSSLSKIWDTVASEFPETDEVLLANCAVTPGATFASMDCEDECTVTSCTRSLYELLLDAAQDYSPEAYHDHKVARLKAKLADAVGDDHVRGVGQPSVGDGGAIEFSLHRSPHMMCKMIVSPNGEMDRACLELLRAGGF